jgi:hypothetical protein
MPMEIENFGGWEDLERRLRKQYKVTDGEVADLLRRESSPLPPLISAWIADALESKLPRGRAKQSPSERVISEMRPLPRAAAQVRERMSERHSNNDRVRGALQFEVEKAVADWGIEDSHDNNGDVLPATSRLMDEYRRSRKRGKK